jgi:hypothetical protein
MSQHVQDMLYFFKQFLRPLLFFSEEALDFGYDFHVSESHPTVAMSNSSLLPSKRHSTFVMCNSSLFLKTSSQLPPWHPFSSHLKKGTRLLPCSSLLSSRKQVPRSRYGFLSLFRNSAPKTCSSLFFSAVSLHLPLLLQNPSTIFAMICS